MAPRKPQRSAPLSFYRDDIISALELDPNQTHAPIARLCAILGIERGPQERRTRANSTLAAGVRTLTFDDDDLQGPALSLRTDLVPLWLIGIDAESVNETLRDRLRLFQNEAASLLWQSFKPQGYGSEDALLPTRYEQNAAEIAYVSEVGTANLARQQLMIERRLAEARAARDGLYGDPQAPLEIDDPQAALLAQTVRRVAMTLAERTRRNEYSGVFSGLFRQFGITSYRRMPAARLHEALEWLERWHGDILGEPEPPPDI